LLRDERGLLPISRRGDALSESEVYAVLLRDVGDPSERLERAPTAKRDELFKSTEALGGVGIGEDSRLPLPSYLAIGIEVVE
jgi:hypothetical protein